MPPQLIYRGALRRLGIAMEVETHLISLIRVLGQVAIIVYAYSWVIRIVERGALKSVAVGLLFGLVGILSMGDPIQWMPGVIQDGRSILLVLTPIYGGLLGTIVAAAMMALFRYMVGGMGAVVGVAGIVIVAIAGYVLTLLPRQWTGTGWRRSALFGLATCSSIVVVFLFPWAVARALLISATLPVTIVNILGVMLLSDLLQREQYRIGIQRALENEASLDPLTRLPNRRVLQREGDRCSKEAGMRRIPFSIIMLDIDHFKKINDSWGHSFGDTVLARLADVIRQTVRKTDIAARYGGEEIVVLLPNTDTRAAAAVAEKIRKDIEDTTLMFEQEAVHVTVSIGIACSLEPTTDFKHVLEAADKALYRAKAGGRNRVELAEAV
ncbi:MULTISPECIES: diguanylate cyclase [Rhizobium]|jgi:diguanylate cyclase|uniref:diguanylate cyclase n=1 Tax=Rhizobium miluonense TaxID=411945 RepID=A0ABU1SU17_9HYPH|nr:MULTISPECIES: diguanylate cyclase [Rhizobium]MBB3425808.1 diguanylate cyclase [Rhizobium sp. BK312]MDR6902460.1 diguanylate cyclase [Rhizobium miluonense]